MATKKRKRFAEGGISEAADKEAGLKASKGEKVGFLERLRMGNIDDERSEAYRRFGAGRGKAERTPVEDAVATPVAAKQTAEVDELEAADLRHRQDPIEVSAGPRAASSAKKSSAGTSKASPAKKASDAPSYTRSGGPTAEELANYKPPVSSKYPDIRGSAQDSLAAETRRRVREGDQAVERVTPETSLLPVGSLKSLNAAAKALANRGSGTAKTAAQKAWERSQMAERLKPTQSVSGKTAEQIAREKKTMNPLAWMAGPKSMADDFKRGGKVKKMASGGMTSGASKRGDGIAQRGKTRGRIY